MTSANLILARMGEITLKGLNRGKFESRLMKTLRRNLHPVGNYEVFQSQSRIWIKPKDEPSREAIPQAIEAARMVFGLVSVSPAVSSLQPADTAGLLTGAVAFVRDYLQQHPAARTFKVEAKRGDKRFPWASPQICAACGEAVLEACPTLQVDVHQPDFTLFVEIRESILYYSEKLPAAKGLPIGSSGKGMLLLSGGIDSPVAGYMMASRGMEIEAVYFHTFPYTSDRAKEKVITLAQRLSDYCGRLFLHVVDFTDIQMELRRQVPEDMMTVVMRRVMFRIAEGLARQYGCQALITGESVGQVASQTTEALVCTDAVTSMPVFRPLIGTDKDATIELARRIGTFETSILPYEDCCTVFVAKHPKTRPSLTQAEEAEAKLELDALTREGVSKVETFRLV
ncbi:MAG: tRNA 4-thiouridine(8) synthase ThiI [Oscillospiraceae bacterium]|nr:tRNA 4-thiouridine(8) synthase ThiI [Oscillospiraceae bacterium]MDD4368005.1 tRNA 4-thiouridine(8) synthase ThiI [Oscillospiraceae bacterium]